MGEVEVVIDDFMAGYYGPSGKHIRQYFDLLQNQITPETHMHIGLKADDPIFSDDFVEESIKILNNAQSVANNYVISRRVEVAALPILFLKFKRSPEVARIDGTFKKFLEIIDKEGIVTLSEYGESLDVIKEFVLKEK